MHAEFGFHWRINTEAIWTLISFALVFSSSQKTLPPGSRVGSQVKLQDIQHFKVWVFFSSWHLLSLLSCIQTGWNPSDPTCKGRASVLLCTWTEIYINPPRATKSNLKWGRSGCGVLTLEWQLCKWFVTIWTLQLINNSLSRIVWIIDQRQMLLKIHVHPGD